MNIARALDQGKLPSNEISIAKVFVSELWQCAANIGMRILGLQGTLEEDSKWARLNGLITRWYQRSVGRTIYMGTSEIQRNIVATRGLGLSRG
jgi:alkylation response protein AidB-like acyl-CoA dehydrogenase